MTKSPRTPASRFPAAAHGASRRRLAALLVLLLPLLAAACLTVSRQEEIEMGRDYAAELDEELPLIRDEAVLGPVSETGLELARLSPRPDLPYEFKVINTNVINAFAVPGGFIYMNRGLLEESANMSEVAGVLAHEVGHVVARHSAEQLERARAAGLGLTLGSIVFGRPSGLAQLGVNVAANLYFARHSREDESEADRLAVDLMVDAGWHPCGMVAFFRTMMVERGSKPGALTSLFASHPLTEERIREVGGLVAALPPGELEGLRHDVPAHGAMLRVLEDYPPPPEKYRVDEEEDEADEAALDREAADALAAGVCPAG